MLFGHSCFGELLILDANDKNMFYSTLFGLFLNLTFYMEPIAQFLFRKKEISSSIYIEV